MSTRALEPRSRSLNSFVLMVPTIRDVPAKAMLAMLRITSGVLAVLVPQCSVARNNMAEVWSLMLLYHLDS
jgi:hypothetical protein